MNESVIIKSDVRGRVRYNPEQRSALLAAFESSGLSGPRFAALHGVKYQTLANWIGKHKRGALSVPPAAHPALLTLVPAELEPSAGAGPGMEVLVPGGVKLIVTTPGQVQLAAALVKALHNPLSC